MRNECQAQIRTKTLRKRAIARPQFVSLWNRPQMFRRGVVICNVRGIKVNRANTNESETANLLHLTKVKEVACDLLDHQFIVGCSKLTNTTRRLLYSKVYRLYHWARKKVWYNIWAEKIMCVSAILYFIVLRFCCCLCTHCTSWDMGEGRGWRGRSSCT